jgi:hypothetical protein
MGSICLCIVHISVEQPITIHESHTILQNHIAYFFWKHNVGPMEYTAGSSSLEPALITKQAGIVKKGVSACQQFCGDAAILW